GRYHVGLWDMLLSGTPEVDELAIVGQQQQTGGVVIEPADALHVAPDELRRQQREHRSMVLRPMRALMIRRLVQHQIGLVTIAPGFAVELEHQTVGVEFRKWIVDDLSMCAERTVANVCPAFLASAETL